MRMRKYSRVYKVGERKFRYNYEENILEYIHVKTEKDEAFNKEWMEEFGASNTWYVGVMSLALVTTICYFFARERS